jgi:hypothetical protein
MASRKEEKERLRREREERERQDKAAAERKARLTRIGGGLAVLLVVGAIIAIVALSGGDDGGGDPVAAAAGLQETQGPWPVLTEGLEDREAALDLPAPHETIYHVHAQLKVFVNGKPQTVPVNIGIKGDGSPISLHSHDEKGIIHMEAVEEYPFTLGQYFTVWGVKFTPTQLGAFRTGPGLALETYVNGKKVPNGPAYQIKASDRIVVIFGKPGSAPKDFKLDPAAV